ncbi:MAG: AAA family ATPase [Bacteroidia bacterium]|nr:AAA family ATPase [Bacteroidia bacterium]
MTNKVFQQIWDQLRGKRTQYKEFLEKVTIKELRGIKDLTVRFSFPVSVIAGPNACGKSTVLFACACAYKAPSKNHRNYFPSTLFPNLMIKANQDLSDKAHKTSFEFGYIYQGKNTNVKWNKGKSWGPSASKRPERILYLRTITNLSHPTEVRSVLRIGLGIFQSSVITSDLIAFAQRILPFQYQEVVLISKNQKDLLFVKRSDIPDTKYSEFHMSAGERAILRISKDISDFRDAIVLIDEIEAGLHPFTQQQFMLELQRIALRNNLQIIVSTHSPVILECVPVEARIFLERTSDNVIIKPVYKDIIQKAFYGQSVEKLNILCEDDIGEAFILGVLDVLNPVLCLIPDDIKVGHDTGKDEFVNHIVALSKFQQLDNFIFILDGDAHPKENELISKAKELGSPIKPLFLPGDVPEFWAWTTLNNYSVDYAGILGITQTDLLRTMQRLDQLFNNAADRPAQIMKNKFITFCENLKMSNTELMRKIARLEAQRQSTEIKSFMQNFELLIRNWQSRK